MWVQPAKIDQVQAGKAEQQLRLIVSGGLLSKEGAQMFTNCR